VDWARAALARVTLIGTAETAQEIQVSIVASAPIRYRVRDVRPNWIVIDVLGAELGVAAGVLPPAKTVGGSPVQKVRVGQFEPDVVRVVVELVRPLKFRITPSSDMATLLVGIPMEAARAKSPAPAATSPAQPDQKVAPREGQAASVQPPQAQTAPSGALRIESGRGIGPVRLGMRIQNVVAVLGPPLGTKTLPDGNIVHRWFEPPKNSGLGVRVTPGGVVFKIWTLNDTRYVTRQRLHVGSTEAEVRAALGEPSRMVTNSDLGMKTLLYESQGIWVSIQLDQRYALYNTVFEIGVMEPKIASQAPN